MNRPKQKPRKRVRCTSPAARELFTLFEPKIIKRFGKAEPAARPELNVSRECARRMRQMGAI